MRGKFLRNLWKGTGKRLSKNGLLTIFRHTWSLFAVFLVVLAIAFTLFRALTPLAKQYQYDIQQQLSIWVGTEVTVQDIETSWYWFTPVLKLNQIAIGEGPNRLQFRQVMVGINLFSSLWHRRVQPGVLYIDDAHVILQQQEGHWRIHGFEMPNSQPQFAAQSSVLSFLELLLAQDKLILKHLSAELQFADGRRLALQEIHIKADHHAENYRVHAQANLRGKPDVRVTMIANLLLDGPNFYQLSGQIYLSLSSIDLMFAQTFFQFPNVHIQQGHGSMSAWVDVVHGRVSQIQAAVDLKNVVLQEPSRVKPRKISNAIANLAWQETAQGWRLTADHMNFDCDGVVWPDNAGLLEYHAAEAKYHAYLKTLPLKRLLQTELPWPEVIKPILAFKPQGVLSDIEISWQQGQICDLLTRFSSVSWRRTATVPGVTGLSGAIYWQPTEGRLELNGEHSTIRLQKPLLPIDLDLLSISLDWKLVQQIWQVNLDKLVLTHPNLVLSAVGTLDDPWGAAAKINMQMDFSAKEAQFWLPYIPAQGLKPKFHAWLKQDIPRIAHASGRLKVAGLINDFPFDQKNGEFSIQSHVNGVDLLINEEWPVNANMDADIQVNGRHFSADVHEANLAGAMVHQVNIAIPDIGLGKEIFLLHGAVRAPGEQIKAYVFSSPLRERFARWKAVTVKDQLGLDLNLELPLYPESDKIYAKGSLDFKQNPVEVAVVDNPAEFAGITGHLEFNEYGLTSGGLDGMLDDHLFTLRVQPLVGPDYGTELRIDGEIDLNYLQYLVHHPIFSVMQGRFIVTGLWTVYPNSPNNDKLYLNSSLAGMAIRLPKPFDKPLAAIAPLSVKIDFSPKQRMDFVINYAQKLSGVFSMQYNAQQKWVTSGDLHWGQGRLLPSRAAGLRMTGVLPEININEWQAVWEKWPKETNSASFLTSLTDLNLTIDKVTASQMVYPDVTLHAHQLSGQEWSFRILQKDLVGDFKYNWVKNSVSAHLDRFDMDLLQSSPNHEPSKWSPKLENIPNLNVIIDSVNFQDIDIGKMSFSSETKTGQWTLNNGKLETPEYELSFAGDWTVQDNKQFSSFDAQLHLSRLANALERWHITPVVDARYGQLSFSGKWPSAFYDGSLRKLNGEIALILKDGHISHLDRDTEKKLGLGKLLSILSLQTIPRRLKLDFSDLAQKGYSFDIFKGSFQIHQGVMNTDDSYIDGPVAFGRMSGDLDLINHLYDLDLRIFPYITASLPLVATIVGSPIAGAAVWAVSSLASKGMQKISGYTYKISGPWMSPVVQQTSIDKSIH